MSTTDLAYLDGILVPAAELALPVFDAGLALGVSVTELLRTFHHRIYLLQEHLDRLAKSLRIIRLDPGLSVEELGARAEGLIVHNARSLSEDQDLGMVILVTAGHVPTYRRMTGATNKRATVVVHTFPLAYELYAQRMREGAKLITVSVRQLPAECVQPHVKSRSRMHYWLAEQEAKARCAEALPLLLDSAGFVRETPAANILIVRGSSIISPPSSTILNGASRAVAIRLLGALGIHCQEREISPAEVAQADEAILTSTPYCAMSVTALDGKRIGSGRPGPIYAKLMQAWNAEVGLDIRRQIEASAQ